MFKFLFGGKKTPDAVPETDREQFKRLTTDLNALIGTLAVKPKVTLDPATGHIALEEPEQFADEALALPAPEVENTAAGKTQAKAEDTAVSDAGEKITEGDAVTAPAASVSGAPKPKPPQPNSPQPRTP